MAARRDRARRGVTLIEFGVVLAILGTPRDPWGNPYQYLPLDGASPPGGGGPGGGGGAAAHARKDRFLVPIDTDFDLYSMGKDGQSASALPRA
jgi:general secretion pathway protein G